MIESLFGFDRSLIFREVFKSQQDTEFINNASITDVSFSNGIAGFNGSTSKIDTKRVLLPATDDWTIHLRMKVTSYPTNNLFAGQYLSGNSGRFVLQVRGSGIIEIQIGDVLYTDENTISLNKWHSIVITRSGTNVKIYVDGEEEKSGTLSNSIYQGDTFTIGKVADFSSFNGDIDLFEIYHEAKSSEWVKNVFMKKLNKQLQLSQNEIVLWYTSIDGIIKDRKGNSITNTNVKVKRDGSIFAGEFDGNSSKLDLGSIDDLTGDITILCWIKFWSLGEGDNGTILHNGELSLRSSTQGRLLFDSKDGGSGTAPNAFSATNTIIFGEYLNISTLRKSDGKVTIFVNSIQSGDADQDSGTPVAGSNIIIGNRSDQSSTFDGYISMVGIMKGLLSTEQINQFYENTKHLFGK